MHRLFLLGVLFVVVLAGLLGALLFVSLFPYFHTIGLAATGVIIIGLACCAALIISFTVNKIGTWNADRRHRQLHSQVVSIGEVVAYLLDDGTFVHLSAMHEAAKIQPLQIAPPKEKEPEPSDNDTVIELYNEGLTLRNIVEATGRSFYEVQKITSEYAKKQGGKKGRKKVIEAVIEGD